MRTGEITGKITITDWVVPTLKHDRVAPKLKHDRVVPKFKTR